jgi:hypothetical protein
MKIDLPDYLIELIDEVRKITGESQGGASRRLLALISLAIGERKIDLGIEWSTAWRRIEDRRAPSRNFEIDISELERSKNRSGFAGVYFHSGKFRALVPDPTRGGAPKTLPGRDESVDAAIDRYRWFEEHGMPYGAVGTHVEQWQEENPDWSVEKCLIEIVEFRRRAMGSLKPNFTIEQAEAALARYRAKNGIEAPVPVEPEPEPINEPGGPENVVVACVVCSEPIENDRELAFAGSEFRHKSCPDPSPN